ncbi:DUF2905 family protein [Anoxynatronum sibiricum]|uniref:DUF2905 family protein n=1 Tax=Anoxynatronum sibiricum TaxID=210623 RepID=A0ABU9VQ99_9CLOT
MFLGLVLFLIGCCTLLANRMGLGRLPGDFMLQRKNITMYFPLATSLLVSLLLTILLNLFFRR